MHTDDLKEEIRKSLSKFANENGLFPSEIRITWISVSGNPNELVHKIDIVYKDKNTYFK